jgi:hypothetical protein
MNRICNKSSSLFTFLPGAVVAAALVLGMTVPMHTAAAAAKEVTLASAKQALKYCQSGKMPSSDIAYISGAGGVAQFGPGSNCVQQVPSKTLVKKAVEVSGTRILECNLAGPTIATQLCQNGGMGEWDIGYISGKPGRTMSGVGYGCVVNYSTTGIGNAICK